MVEPWRMNRKDGGRLFSDLDIESDGSAQSQKKQRADSGSDRLEATLSQDLFSDSEYGNSPDLGRPTTNGR